MAPVWLRDRQESRLSTFEEARDSVIKIMLPGYKDQALVEWIAEVRERRGVTSNRPVLEQIALGS